MQKNSNLNLNIRQLSKNSLLNNACDVGKKIPTPVKVKTVKVKTVKVTPVKVTPVKVTPVKVVSIMQEESITVDENRLTILPIKHQKLWDLYKKHESMVWHASEVKLTGDLDHWEKLNDDERHFIETVIAFFASSDIIVAANLGERFIREVRILEADFFYSFQKAMENIHSEVYSNMLNAYIKDETKKTFLINAVENIPAIKKKAKWAMKWIKSDRSLATRLIAFIIVEGLFFSGAFCCIFWLAERGIMNGLCKGNEFIARDEAIHTEFGILLYNMYIKNKLSPQEFIDIMTEAVNIEIEFITESLPCKLIGMNSASMIMYIKYICNRLCVQLNYDKIYPNVNQPFDFMDRISLATKSSFFETEVGDYAKTVHSNNVDAYADI